MKADTFCGLQFAASPADNLGATEFVTSDEGAPPRSFRMSFVYAVLLALVACALLVEIVSALRRSSRPLQALTLRTDPMPIAEDRRGLDLAFVGRDRRAAAPAEPGPAGSEEERRRVA